MRQRGAMLITSNNSGHIISEPEKPALFKENPAFDAAIKELNVTAYVCGGTVRDLRMNRNCRDVDVVLSDRVFEAARLFQSKIDAPYFVLDQERQVVRVICENQNWDFSGFRNRTIEGDLKMRDFTINAMALQWNDFYPQIDLSRIIDPSGGISDIEKRLIRMVSPESLQDDPLRMLRAFRLAAELQFFIDPEVEKEIGRIHPSIANVAGERISEEILKVLQLTDSASFWETLGSSSLFGSLFPEMFPMKGCEQGGYHHLDVWLHSIEALRNLEKLLLAIPENFERYAEPIRQYLASPAGAIERQRLLRWAMILHDIGKPKTQELKEPGRWRFHGHDHTGADLASALLSRLKLSRKDTLLVSMLIENHLRPLNLFNLDQRSEDDFFRFFRVTKGESIGVLLMSYGDVQASRGPMADPSRDAGFLEMLQQMLRFYFEEYYPKVNMPELIKGRDLMAVLQMKPGPSMGKLLDQIREEQLRGNLKNRQQALDFARRWLRETAEV